MGEARVRAMRGVRRGALAALLALATTAGLLPVAAAGASAGQTSPPRFVVDAPADAVDVAPGDGACATATGACSLRAAVAEANATSGAVIELPAGTYRLDGGAGSDTGDLDLRRPMTVAAAGPATVDGAARDRVLDVLAPGVIVAGVVVTGGAARDGAGINVAGGAGLTLRDSTLVANTATNEGGGIANAGSTTVSGSTIAGNTADRRGGGIYGSGTTSLVNTTIHANRSNAGGGMISTGTADLRHVTITANESTNRLGGGLQRQGGVVTLRASIVAENLSNSGDAKDCSGSPTLDGLNLIGNPSGCNPTGTAPLTGSSGLAALADNGGPTHTQALLPGSQALDRLDAPCLASVDQRGVARPSGPRCDLGAYELQALGVGLTLDSTLPADGLGAGAATVPLDALRQAATGPVVPDGTTGAALRSIALRSIALRSIDVESVALRSIALRSIALRSIALRSIALRSIFTASTALRSIALRSILLSDVEIDVAGGWEGLLDGTSLRDVPLQTLTLEDVAGLPQVQALTLEDVDLSATRIGSLSIVGLLLGTTALRSIPLSEELQPDGTSTLDAWCALLGATPCPVTEAELDTVSLLSLDLEGIALRSIALRSILLAGLDLTATALRSIPLVELAPGSLADVVDCTKLPCTAPSTTLGDADAVDALRGTMADVLLALLGDEDLGWEDLDLEGGDVQAVAAPSEPTVTYEIGIDLQGATPADVALTLTLPPGFAYQRGSARLDAATSADPAADGPDLDFTLAGLAPGHHELTIAAWAGLHLGAATTTARATATSSTGTATSPLVSDDVTVGEAFEAPAPADDQRPIGDDRLHIAHLSFTGDVDLYAFEVTPDDAARGTTASIRLGNVPADYDLALYGPPLDPLRDEPTERRDLLPDHQLDLAAGDDHLTAEPTADVPQALPFASSAVIHRVSARRSDAAEQIDTGSLRAGTYWVQVSGANGASSDLPYSLQLRLDTGIDRGVCAAAPFPFTMPPAGALPDTSAGTLDTVFLVNTRRLAAAYGAEAPTVVAALSTLAARTDIGVHGAVVPVDGDPAVDAAYALWDADRCSAEAANEVVRRIGDLLDGLRAANPDLENVVLVGDDLQVPFARVPDATRLSNEQSFADTFAGNNELVAAFAGGFVLTDNPYGTSAGIAVNDHELFVPELAVGRLVETPEEIVDAVDRFTAAGGVLDPASALVTGYDFLADGAGAVAAALGGATELISEDWDRADLEAAITGLDAPAVASVNAHFDHTRLLPGLGNSTGDETDLFTTADVAGAVDAALTDALLFSMGCHSGLAVSDITVGAVVPDWAQTFADVGGGWVANTGFGYGDTELVALSEALMARFAARLVDGDSAGIALAAAKQEYAAAVALVSPYDEKVVHEATLYGLPMLRLPGPAEPAAALTGAATGDEPPLVHDPHTGLPAAGHDLRFTISTDGTGQGPDVLTPVGSDDGSWFHVDGDTLNQAHRPVQPRTTVDVSRTADGAGRATGVLVTQLTSVDLDGFDPLFFSPTVDHGEHEPRSVAADATFPARFVDVTATDGPGGTVDRLVVVPGQFRRSAVAGTGTQRLFTSVETLVYYGDAAAGAAPPIGMRHTTAAASDGVARFQVDLDGVAERVYVLYKQQGVDAAWTGIDLAPGPGNSWFGEGPGEDPLEYIVQAVSPTGQVSWATSKGDDFGSVPGGDTGEITIGISGPTPTAGWYPGPVTVTITGGAGLQFSVDGGGYVPYLGSPFPVGGDGLHSIVARDDSGALETVFVAIDTAAPTVVVSQEPAGSAGWVGPDGATVTLTATDGVGSGVASISSRVGDGAMTTVAGSVATVAVGAGGTSTITFRATDVAGNTSADGTHVVRLDDSPPTVDCGLVDTQWHDTNVSRTCTASDAGSGLADAADASFTLATDVTDGAASAAAPTATREVCDAVGNCTTAGPLTFMVDRADPTISIASPLDGADVARGDALVADFACADVGSGVAAVDCTATIGSTSFADGATLPTATGGSFTLTVSAVDGAGNQATASATYHVAAFDICLLYDPDRATSVGSAAPIRIQLCDAAGNNLSSRSIEVRAIRVDGGDPIDEGASNDGNVFRYDPRLRGYIYNLDTTGLAAGRHELELSVDGVEAASYLAPFTVR
jgi:hypothetical protein